jgi:4-amino-4-deoxy-L-arabinose transferase-like glycosyltransferase
MTKKQVFLFLILIIALASFFRLWQIKSVPQGFSYDEAMYANNAVEAWETGNFKMFYTENNGREGLWINILAPVLAVFGNQPWVSRSIAAIFGILTVLGLYFLTKVLFGSDRIALLASFFLAVSFWHINFSRIGFRAILSPFFLVWSFYFLWKLLRQAQAMKIVGVGAQNFRGAKILGISNFHCLRLELFAVIGGLLFGFGFHTYIAFRVAPLLLIIPFYLMWKRKQKKLIIIFCLFAFIAALPIGIYFLQNPQDFFGRSSQVSVFSAKSPLLAVGWNTIKTIGMFFVWGDSNWRHNLRGSPELWWPVAILFLIGLIIGIWKLVKRARHRMKIVGVGAQNFREAKILGISNFQAMTGELLFLFAWFVVMLIPAIISSEGLPHSLRSICAAPVAMIFAALGLEWIILKTTAWLRKKAEKYPGKIKQLLRIKKEFIILLFVFLIAVAGQNFNQYFFRWANNPVVADAFDESYTLFGKYLNTLPKNIPKYVIINTTATGINDNPYEPPAIMFLTDTYVHANRTKYNLFYVNPKDIAAFAEKADRQENFYITMLEFNPDINIFLRNKISGLKIDASSGIIVLYR